MTAPRQVIAGTTALVTRRCSERRMFLRPSKEMNELFLYSLGVAAARYEILIHAACVLSNHVHLVLTDPLAQLPAFMRDLGSTVARAGNALIKHWEGFWSSEASYSSVTLTSPDTVVDKIAYVLANPVAACLVQHGREWPGVRISPEQLESATLQVSRPKGFFSVKGGLPESATLKLAVPPGFASAQEYGQAVTQATEALEHKHRCEAQAAQRPFLEPARILAQDPHARPASDRPRRTLNPRVAGHDEEKRVTALQQLKEFLHAYRDALARLKAGSKDVIFPAGTYKLRVEFGVRCAA